MPLPAIIDTSASRALTYLALGDSYTIGQNVRNEERFPYLLAQQLRDSGFHLSEPRYIARTGWTTDELQAAIVSENPPANFDFVTLLIGVNDQYRGRDTNSYRVRFTALLQTSIQLAGGRAARVFVVSIPDYSATPYVAAADKARVRMEIDQFNAINRRITEAAGISYTYITDLTRAVSTQPLLLASDNLHYSAFEHLLWAKELAPKLVPVLH
jgi:lysophospholipase L1-like esterase